MQFLNVFRAAGFAAALLVAQNAIAQYADAAGRAAEDCGAEIGGEVWIDGASFTMGDDKTYPDEAPAHKVTVDGFWIDAHEVTNAQFAAFVEATGYATRAERTPNPEETPGAPPELLQPGSAVFTPPRGPGGVANWWTYVPGASWRNPTGPDSTIDGKERYPVVHIAFEDAAAYAAWAGRELPTEAQYELAARSKREGERYAWGGEKLAPGGAHQANTWQGVFPIINTQEDSYAGLAPVGCFPPNAYGAYDLIGNVWEWTTNWYAPGHTPTDNRNPKGPPKEESYDRNSPGLPVRVIKGGSFLCAPNFCMRYRPAARHAQDTGLGTNHIGFRTVRNAPRDR